MGQSSVTVEQLVQLAKEVESNDPISWDYLNIDEDSAYRLIASSVIEMYNDWVESGDNPEVILATMTKLIVENFTLNLKLLQQK